VADANNGFLITEEHLPTNWITIRDNNNNVVIPLTTEEIVVEAELLDNNQTSISTSSNQVTKQTVQSK
jgi:stress response protein YsnF